MKKKISFEEIGCVAVTFLADDNTAAGQVVKVTANDTVGPCSSGDKICGVALEVSGDGVCSVQVEGFAALPVSGTVDPGWVSLEADGDGGVKAAAQGSGKEYLVVSVAGGEAVVLL